MEDERQKKIFEINLLDAQLKQLEQQAIMIEQQFAECQSTLFNLDELNKAKKGSEMLFPLGRDIFVEGSLNNSANVFVNIGAKTVMKKSVDGAKKITENNRGKLISVSEEIRTAMQEILSRILQLEKELNTCDDPNCSHEHH